MQYSIVNYKKLERTGRLDSEFYQPVFWDLHESLSKVNTVSIASLCKVSDGNHMSVAKYFQENDGVPYYRGQDINTSFFLEDAKHVYIPEEIYEEGYMRRSHFQVGDVLLSIVGTVGSLSLVTENIPKSTGSCKLAILRPLKISSEYLSIFLMCKYGNLQIKRNTRGAVQTGLLLEDMDQIYVFTPNKTFEEAINQLVKKSILKNRYSKSIYSQAEQIILSELGISNWQPKHCLSFVKNYSDTEQAERIDAEYFQPKYEEIVKAIKDYSGGWDTIGNIASLKKCVEVGSDAYMDEGDVPFVRVSNLSPFEITEEKYVSAELYTELLQHQPKQGEILLSKDATPGIAYHLNEKPKKMIPSGGILRLQLKNKNINEDYLTLVLNSLIVKEQINRDVGGSVILHWRPEQVRETLIPILPEDKQSQIQQKVIESFNLRKQSKYLLECAKRAVEIAIEQNEDAAIKWLQEQINANGRTAD